MLVICRKNGGESVVFTDGKTYVAEHFKNALYQVTDDRGHIRYIIPDAPCPHIKSRAFSSTGGFTVAGDNSVGVFEIVKHDS